VTKVEEVAGITSWPGLSEAMAKRRRTPRPKRRSHRPHLLERRLTRFLREPPSVRTAIGAIVTATVVVVVVGGVIIRVVDHREYSSIWVGMWWALQTVTTVGYGDVTPENLGGRIVAALVMLEGLAFLAIITAAITSTFIARATRELGVAQRKEEVSDRKLMEQRFDRLERRLDELQSGRQRSGDG